MRTFTFNEASKVVKHYQYLIGTLIDSAMNKDAEITDVVIVPINPKQFQTFVNNFNQNSNNELSLIASGYDSLNVNVIVLHHDTFRGDVYFREIDGFLEKRSIERIYLKGDF